MAPEVLRGKPYTKAADIYSFGIIMWELTSDICKGLRPKIVESTLPIYERLMKRCLNSDPNKRPTADELVEILSIWIYYYLKRGKKIEIPIPNNEPITKNHPLSCYTSKKINYSAKLNEILTQEELSTKIVVYEEKLLSESLETCMILD
ncbi:kinase-like domain-containing protein [Rhizophagus irregularis DAOM 181602=DAOM 197198]|uniref:Kinase-like domain-containing protein n=2 Tax=Rhizophagus irregularis (strain DAOM 181602 / DAOM 197198 / MUCL 43194) TaxID=747089 RepID=A0A2P4Q6Z4_RHIID|nr:kinase-like domain-containing protein [Rhizophagus irregularis DAOM 181602=DAOM 197198]POG73394.1 kinase-like domain-containing protein [Rhizophagus irregularis DAOM 181602=DAOM 197198]|eukprot:XP_025180260.1 kinase-like domain-containing protein [Rhizophagus irregularis DAOM 181602=DAOM 197198]